MFDHLKTYTDQGNLGEARAIYEFSRLGFTVLKPLTNNNKYDLVVEKNNILSKVSVKTTKCKQRNGYVVNLATKGGNTKTNTIKTRDENDFQFLFVLTETNECYMIPSSGLGDAKHSIVVGNKYSQYKL